MWAALAAVYVVSYFHRIAPAVIAKDLMASFAATGAQVGTMAALYLYAFALMQLVVGALVDRWGPRRAVSAGALVMAAGTACFAAAPALPVAYGARVLIGVGASVVFIGTLKQIGFWYRAREFATLTGWTQVAGNAGGLAAATPLALAVAAWGWRASFAGVALLSAVLAWLCWRTVRDRPEEVGLPSIAAIEAAEEGRPPPSERRVRVDLREGYAAVWGNRRTWPLFGVFFGVYGTLLAFSGLWGVPYLRDVYGVDASVAAGYMSAVAVGVIVGAPLAGYLSDRVFRSRRAPFTLFAAVYAGCWAVLALAGGGRPPAAWLGPLCVLLGASAAGFTLTWAIAREVNPLPYSGIATATVNAGGFAGAAALQSAVSAVVDTRWGGTLQEGARVYPIEAYRAAWTLCFAVAAAACLLSLAVAETRGRNVYAAG